MGEVKVKNLISGDVHLLRTFKKTHCGINIKRDELNWVIVGGDTPITCSKKNCSCREGELKGRKPLYRSSFAKKLLKINRLRRE